MQVLILGANGGLGQTFCRTLDKAQISFEAAAKNRVDITNAKAVSDQIHQLKPHVVINCAAFTAVDKAEENVEIAEQVNFRAVQNLAQLSIRAGFQLVHFSTDYVFDGAAREPYREDSYTNPLGVYGQTKLMGDSAALWNPQNLVVRTSWLYSDNGKSFPAKILGQLAAGKTPWVVNDQFSSPTYAQDLAEATLDLIQIGASGLYNYSSNDVTSWFNFAHKIAELYSIQTGQMVPRPEPVRTSELNLKARRPTYSALNTGKIRALGIRTRPWEDSLRDHLKKYLQDSPHMVSSEASI